MTERELMSQEEIHDFGVEIVFGCLKKEGYIIEGVKPTYQRTHKLLREKVMTCALLP